MNNYRRNSGGDFFGGILAFIVGSMLFVFGVTFILANPLFILGLVWLGFCVTYVVVKGWPGVDNDRPRV